MQADIKRMDIPKHSDGKALSFHEADYLHTVDAMLKGKIPKADIVVPKDDKNKPIFDAKALEKLEVVPTTKAEASISMSGNALAVRLVPVDASGTEHPSASISIVAKNDDPDVGSYLDGAISALNVLIANGGF